VSDSELVDSASSQISGAESLSPDNEDDSGELWILSAKQELAVASGMSFGESNLSEKSNVLSDSELDVSFSSLQAGQYMCGSCW